ncbi:MAG: DUF5362 family protein [Ferruginibacter sp.]
MENDQSLIDTELVVDSAITAHLKETAAWGKFLAVIGFIYSGLIAIGAIYAVSLLTSISGNYGGQSQRVWTGGSIAFLYFGFAAIIFYMSVYLYHFAKKTQMAIKGNDQATLEDAFRHLKIYFRFAGIITVITIVLSILGVIAMVLLTSFSR